MEFIFWASYLANCFPLQEVKECAISCMGLVVSSFGDQLSGDLPACLPVLVDRMGNEITRLTAVKVCLNSKSSGLLWPFFVFGDSWFR